LLFYSLGQVHDSLDHIVAGLTESGNSLIARALSVFHNHVDVVGSDTILVQGSGIISLGGGDGSGSSGTGTSHSLFSEFLGFSLLHARVLVLKLEFTEDGVGFAIIVRAENLGGVHEEDKTVTLAEGHTGNTGESLHADLKESLAALVLTTGVNFLLVLVFEFGHSFFFGFGHL
jgi:hypothetical protein